jgi:hypothetical protein
MTTNERRPHDGDGIRVGETTTSVNACTPPTKADRAGRVVVTVLGLTVAPVCIAAGPSRART